MFYNSKWKSLCPYYLKTDGYEEHYYQGTKAYDNTGQSKYLWWEFISLNRDGDVLINNNNINYDLYFRWRDPNKIDRRKNTQFELFIDKNGNEERMNYLTSRKRIYFKEYVRLVRSTTYF